MPRRALCLVLLPLLAACPSFAYGPDVYELYEDDPAACELAGIDSTPCSRFEADNGPNLTTDPSPRPLVVAFGFEAFDRNLDYVTVELERPGLPPSQLICPFGYALVGVSTEGLSCESVGLAGFDPVEQDENTPTPQNAAQGVMELQLLIDAQQPGSYAISVWLTDDNDFESQTLRWQFTMREPEREPSE